MKVFFLIFALFQFMFFGCKEDVNFLLEQPFNLKKGDSVIIEDGNNVLKIRLLEINESRCPSDVVCIRAGEVKVKFDMEVNSKSYNGLELCLQCDNTMPIPKDITIEKYSISLLEVTPYPMTTNKNATQIAKMVVK